MEWTLRPRKQRVFAELPGEVVELGPGVGANLRYLRPGATLIAIEPNRSMHAGLLTAAARARGDDRPARPHGRAHRPARPQRRRRDLVVRALLGAGSGSRARRGPPHPAPRRHLPLRGARRGRERHAHPRRAADPSPPWAWTFEGCSCERDLEHVSAPPGSRASASSATGSTARSCRSTPRSPGLRWRRRSRHG